MSFWGVIPRALNIRSHPHYVKPDVITLDGLRWTNRDGVAYWNNLVSEGKIRHFKMFMADDRATPIINDPAIYVPRGTADTFDFLFVPHMYAVHVVAGKFVEQGSEDWREGRAIVGDKWGVLEADEGAFQWSREEVAAMVDFFTKLHSAELIQKNLWHVYKTGVLTPVLPPGASEPGEIDLCADPTTCPQRASGAATSWDQRHGMAMSLAMAAVVSLFLCA